MESHLCLGVYCGGHDRHMMSIQLVAYVSSRLFTFCPPGPLLLLNDIVSSSGCGVQGVNA